VSHTTPEHLPRFDGPLWLCGRDRRRTPDPAFFVRGVRLAVVLGPSMVVAGLVAGGSPLSMVIGAWIPSQWFSGNAADWLCGSGAEGSAGSFFRFMVSGMVAGGCWAAIRWGFTGKTS